MRLLTKTLLPYLFQFRPLYRGCVEWTLELTQESRFSPCFSLLFWEGIDSSTKD